MYRLTLNSYCIILEEKSEEQKMAPIEVVYVGTGSPKTGRKGMHCILCTVISFTDACKLSEFFSVVIITAEIILFSICQ